MIRISQSMLHNTEQALSREWLVTNGTGGYASSTIIGANTRRYHGLLTAAFQPPLERQVVLSKVDEELLIDRGSHPLGSNEYVGGVIHPDGYHHLRSFRLDLGIPTWKYQVGDVKLTKWVWMERGKNTVYVLYRLDSSPEDVKLMIRPFCAFRGYHHDDIRAAQDDFLTDQHGADTINVESSRTAYHLKMHMPFASFHAMPDWYMNFYHREEQERGFDCTEDLYAPGVFVLSLSVGESAVFVATCEREQPDDDWESAWVREMSRRKALVSGETDDLRKALLLSADQFVVRQPSGDAHQSSILAGYHWFTDWGRDTMISLPGLLLSTGRFDEAREILLRYAECADGGMIPNRFKDDGSVEFNTADATLWFFQALHAYVNASGDDEIIPQLFPTLVGMIDRHIRGVRYGIHVDPDDGLLHAGREGSQLTWMDACVNGCPSTPRIGKPVEINALWYNALSLMAEWADAVGVDDHLFKFAAERCKISFNLKFWNDASDCLYDVVDGPTGNDPSIRPNQIMALSLAHTVLDSSLWKSVVDVVERELLTPYGLRTLSPAAPAYAGEYRGGPAKRDTIYHQGTVWPWLLGQFADAHLRAYGDTDRIAEMIAPFRAHLLEAGLGNISEILDGDAPHRPAGCIAQAWSTAEILRILSSL